MSEKRDFGDYYAYLKSEIMTFRGRVPEYVYYLPSLFRALIGVLDSEKIRPKERNMVLCALGYFVAPNDLIPEEIYGPAGYLDDVFVCAWVLQKLVDQHGAGFVSAFWDRDEDPLEQFLPALIAETARELNEKAREVLVYTGLEQ